MLKKLLMIGGFVALTLGQTVNADMNDVVELRNDLQKRGFIAEVREIQYKYFDPHCFGTYGYFQFKDNYDAEFDAVEMYADKVIRYRNGKPEEISIVEFSRLVDGQFFVQITKPY